MKKRIVKNLVWSIIPAKGKSSRVRNKNLKKISNIELFLYSVLVAINTKNISKTFVSTDDIKIAKISKKYGALVPFLRPKKYSLKTSEDHEYISHFVKFILKNYDLLPEYIVQLRPTTPFRSVIDINKALEYLKRNNTSTSLRSSHIADHPPEKQFRIWGNYYCNVNLKRDKRDLFNKPSQLFKLTYEPNGYVDILKTNFLVKNIGKKIIYGQKILPFITSKKIDIDTIEDFIYAENIKDKNKGIIKKYYKKI